MKPILKTLIYKGFLLFLLVNFIFAGCTTSRQFVDVSDYILVQNGKPILGNDGLTAFIFENNPKKKPFQQFLADKYQIGNYRDIEYWVTIDGRRYKVFLYENAELEKYFDTTDYVATNVVPESSVIGSKVKFLALSVINEYNEDCLANGSLYQNIVIKYLRNLKKEYYNS